MEAGVGLSALFVVGGLGGLIVSAHFFLAGALGLAEKFGIPEIIVGSIIVAIGTSAPELAINVVASLEGQGDIVISNLVGSNIVNVCLGVGLAALLVGFGRPKKAYVWPIVLGLLAAIAVVLAGYLGADSTGNSHIPVLVSGLTLLVFVCFMYWSIRNGGDDEDEEDTPEAAKNVLLSVVCLVMGCVGMTLAADYTVDYAVRLATLLAFPPAVIGATLIAAGGSLPEVFSCLAAARLGRPNIIIGNIAGSQIFNLLGILGLSGLVSQISFSSVLAVDALILAGITVLWIALLLLALPRFVMASALLLSYVGYAAYLVSIV